MTRVLFFRSPGKPSGAPPERYRESNVNRTEDSSDGYAIRDQVSRSVQLAGPGLPANELRAALSFKARWSPSRRLPVYAAASGNWGERPMLSIRHSIARWMLPGFVGLGATIFFGARLTAEPRALLIRQDSERGVEIVDVPWPPSQALLKSRGLLIWTGGGGEQWVALPANQLPVARIPEHDRFLPLAAATSRGSAGDGSTITATATLQLDQLVGQLVIRGAGFVTPIAGQSDLDGRLTIRRKPREKAEQPFPADSLRFLRNGRELFVVRIPAGAQQLTWSQLAGLPQPFRHGLPEGEYTLQAVAGGESASFRVESAEIRNWVDEPLNRLRPLLAESDPLYAQVAVEHLLNQKDERGRPAPYLSDALDWIESVPHDKTTPHLQTLRRQLLERIAGGARTNVSPTPEAASGLLQIERARAAVQQGLWSDALKVLTDLDPGSDVRVRGLRSLYRAVILAEYGSATGDAAEELFQESLRTLAGAPPIDRLRVHNNYANFLLTRTQDRVYNHAFQIATGGANPLLSALIDWRGARDHYLQALQLAVRSDRSAVNGIRLNLSRLYVLLADLISTLNSVVRESAFVAGEESATARAKELAAEVLAQRDLSAEVQGIVQETLAQLAYRAQKPDLSREHAQRALANYLQAGVLSGAEGAHRLLGLLELRFSKAVSDRDTPERNAAALRHFLIAQALAEFLRDRVPEDRMGLSMAGYFARRAYVNEQVIELLIRSHRAAEALEFAEAAKARALTHVLRQQRMPLPRRSRERGVEQILQDWPARTTALEYFLGSERGWVFAIRDGKVRAYEITSPEGSPLPSRVLVARVQRLLGEMNMAARRMLQRRQFDHHWQVELHDLYLTLIPPDVRTGLPQTETLLLAPHHVLHYFPFAALVAQRDARQRAALEMPQPIFLLDVLGSQLASQQAGGPLAPISSRSANRSAIASVPSLVSWDLLRRTQRPLTRVNAVGIVDFQAAARLPGVEHDMANLKNAFQTRMHRVVAGEDASEPNVVGLLSEPGLLFIATHGMNLADKPLDSFLLCHPAPSYDGRLTAAEIFGATVSADMVVMSACYSGLADRSPLPGDGLFGLQRAFLHAGAQTVVAGVWDVYDGTGPLLMKRFFEHVANGMPAAAALTVAQRDFLAQQRTDGPGNPWTHPYFWSVYTVAGNPQLQFTSAAR